MVDNEVSPETDIIEYVWRSTIGVPAVDIYMAYECEVHSVWLR